MIHIDYDTDLVIGSIVVALLACYSALSIADFLTRNTAHKNKYLRSGSVVVSGFFFAIAIWLMHFIGLFAFHFPAIYGFDYQLTIISFVIAFIASTFAIAQMTKVPLNWLRLILATVFMGLGSIGMHYVGMMGLVIDGYTRYYNLLMVSLSVVVTFLGIGLTFWVAYFYKEKIRSSIQYRLLLTIMMVASIASMHFIGMSSTSLHVDHASTLETLSQQNQYVILFLLIFITSLIFAVSFIVTLFEQRVQDRDDQLITINRQLLKQSMQDYLTKLPNRLALNEYTQVLFSKLRLKQKSSAFLYIDLDRFKVINDVFGHHMGDQLLIQFANKIHMNLTEQEKIFRIGGDEFLYIIEEVDEAGAIESLEKIQNLLQDGFLIAGKKIHVSASIGVAIFPNHGENLQELMVNADIAMLKAKQQGRNSYTIFGYNQDQAESKHQIALINDLYKAIDEQQFVLLYQAKFKTDDFSICGVEALIRWHHPIYGCIGPDQFIQEAEQTGLIIQIGYWVLEEACRQIKMWEEQNLNLFPVSVNLSVAQFEHQHLFTFLEDLFERYQIKKGHLMIEITESVAMQHIKTSLKSFMRLREMGILLAIDDFGTGHSSFLYLKELPVDELKIDRAFIKDLAENQKDEMIIESIIKIASAFNLNVTAEGVETQEQVNILQKLNCHYLQGYFCSRPVVAQQLEHLAMSKG